MGDLTRNISRHEIACNCGCGFDTLDIETGRIVQIACDHFSRKLGHKTYLYINSGCRCDFWNTHENGSDKSLHMEARAIDHLIRFISPRELYDFYCNLYPDKFGIGLYSGFVHFDTDKRKWRQG